MWLSGLLLLAVTAALRSGAAVQLLLCRWEWWVWLLVLLWLCVLVLWCNCCCVDGSAWS